MIRRAYHDMPHGQLHYRRVHNPGAPRLVLFHQSPSSSAMYGAMMERLGGVFDIVAPDTPGFGQSDAPPSMDIDVIGGILADFLAELDYGGACMFGHHTGAMFAGVVASAAPTLCSALVLCGPPLMDADMRARLPGLALDKPSRCDGSHLTAIWAALQKKEQDLPVEVVEREAVQALACGARNKAMYAAIAQYDFAALLPRISAPTLVMAGDRDVLAPMVEPTSALLAEAYRAAIPGAGSYVCDTHTDALCSAIADFCGVTDGS